MTATGRSRSRDTSQGAVDPAKLIGAMLARFMATDRAFAKLRRADATPQRAISEKPSSEKPT